MTWSRRTGTQRLSQTRYFLRRQLWIWPIIAVFVLGILGVTLRSAIESTIKRNLQSGLQTVLSLETKMLRNWFQAHQDRAESIANEKVVREAFAEMLLQSRSAEGKENSEVSQSLQNIMLPRMSSHNYVGFFAADRNGRILDASHDSLPGRQEIPEYDQFLDDVYEGQSCVSVPFPSVVTMKADSGRMRTGQPTMYVAVPVRDDSYHVIGALAFQIRPEIEFTSILQYGRVGDSGETYAFDKGGVLVSNSRFDEDLILLGLLPDEDDAHSLLNVHIRDPGGDMTTGHRPDVRRMHRPLTVMAQDAVKGNTGVDVEGYRDYRGVRVVGAWTWLPEYQLGVATEVDVAQAFRPIVILQRTFWTLFLLLALSSVAIFVFTLMVARLKRDAQKAAIKAQQLGQYRLDEKLGAGAMGVVYKGHHAMMRRETAIKLLDLDKVNDDSIARFEREVQMTCRLNHPNTIAIYDYGRTPEGVFY